MTDAAIILHVRSKSLSLEELQALLIERFPLIIQSTVGITLERSIEGVEGRAALLCESHFRFDQHGEAPIMGDLINQSQIRQCVGVLAPEAEDSEVGAADARPGRGE